jgi:hypothetical protein
VLPSVVIKHGTGGRRFASYSPGVLPLSDW